MEQLNVAMASICFTQINWWEAYLSNIFKLYAKANQQDKLMEFEEFLQLLSIVVKGNLKQRFDFSFRLVDVDSDGIIDPNQTFKLIQILHDIYKPKSSASCGDFAAMIFQKTKKDNISFDALQEMIIDKPLLESYWNLNDPEAVEESKIEVKEKEEKKKEEEINVNMFL